GVRGALAMESARSTEVNASLLRRADLQPYFEHIERMDPRYFLRAMQAAAEHGAEDHLGAIHVPTLVVAGDRDRFTPTWLSRRMALEIPSAELFLVRGGSHTALLERPEEVNRAVLDFLQRLGPTGRRAPPCPPAPPGVTLSNSAEARRTLERRHHHPPPHSDDAA